ncbi:MAG: hypothetical protein CMP61_09910 [Flavobacteriales bacterium]|nr:hypothetical protein [Flavobacteriales bacterium]|tara:strand:+ start:1455 stop:2018 length:564 start_codon:yes stop_codon:yes gene_type:complete
MRLKNSKKTFMHKAFWICLIVVVFGCDNSSGESHDVDPLEGMSKEERNKIIEKALINSTQKEEAQIKGYLKRHQIPAQQTETGVYYYIYQSGKGEQIQDGQHVVVDYVVTKINGDTLYTTQKKLDEFRVANSEKESGLHEAIKLLKSGSKAIIILPSHRAHGISGDTEKIPPLSTVIYNLTVKNVNE